MNDTVFFVLGIGLVIAALAVAFVGIRFERFPASRGMLLGIMAGFALLVVATATFAWRNAADEQEHKQEELAAAADEASAQGNETQALQDEGSAAPTTSTTTTASVDGKQVFESAGCTGCHTLADAGSTATTGPDLDGALKGKTQDFIKTSIADPSAEIEKGYPPNVMPETYATQLSPEELDALVQYLAQATGAKG